eukprot:4494073-Amphidinium_carterae.1
MVLLLQVATHVTGSFLLLLKARKTTSRWAWQAGPAYSCRCDGGLAQGATEDGPGYAGPLLFKATNRGPGWAGPFAFHANEALQRRAAKGRPC